MSFIRPSGAKVGGGNKRGRWGLFLRVDEIHKVKQTHANKSAVIKCPGSSQIGACGQLAAFQSTMAWRRVWEKALKRKEGSLSRIKNWQEEGRILPCWGAAFKAQGTVIASEAEVERVDDADASRPLLGLGLMASLRRARAPAQHFTC